VRKRDLLASILAVGCARHTSSQGAPGEADVAAHAPTAAEALGVRAGTSPAPPSAGDSAAAGSPASESRAGPASSGSPTATMKLLDPGRAPRHKLRYTWRPDRKELLAVDLRTATSTETPGDQPTEIPLPPLHIVISIDPRSVAADGSLLYAWQVTSATVAENRDTPPQVADGMRTELSTIARLSGTAEVSTRGLATEVFVDPASVTDAGATGQMIEQVRQILRDLAAPFPAEEVGLGARWQKLSQLASKDARITQTDTFSLLELTGNTGTLDDVLAQTAPPQALAASGLAPAAQARLESMLASGDAKTHFDLSRLAPETRFDGTTTMVVSGQSPSDRSRRLTMIMRVGIVLVGSTP